jgi:methylmalonyl-CoA mutase
VKAYGVVSPEIAKLNIRGITSRWNMTVYDPHVNMLRTTTEALSAVVGGVDSLTVRPYDFIFRSADDFSERIARNQQLLIKEESYLDQVADPAAGSYYVEKLTDSIASEAWKLFLEVDAKGGFLQALKDGFIQDKIKQTARRRDQDIASRKTTILGTNQYPEFKEQLELDDDSCLSPDRLNEKGAIVEPLSPYRGAMAFERLRYLTDKYSKTYKRPTAFMFTFGNLAMRVARSQFSRNFFAVAGYEVIDNIGFKSIQEGVDAVKKSKPEIVVICSSDEEYLQIAPEIYDNLKDSCIIVIAGYPKDSIDELKAKGIQHFIHIRSNLLETLSLFNDLLGVK